MDSSRARNKAHWFYGADYQDTDELNIVEFPLAMLSRNSSESKVLCFSDQIFDKAAGESINRSLTISANEITTLPNWWDQDALIALQVITNRRNRFASEVVEFTLYEVLKEMGVPNQTKNRRRLATSLENWTGVLVKYSHWRVGDSWHHPKAFHIIQDFDLTRKGAARPNPEQPQVFAWSRLFAESVRASYSKAFDSGFYFGLKSPTTKRMFRFLDKRLGSTPYYSMELVPFCTDKLGLTRNNYPSEYPQKIKKAYEELVSQRFLADIPAAKRIVKSNGKTMINFRRGPGRKQRSVVSVANRVLPEWATALEARGVNPDEFVKSPHHKDYDFELAMEYWDYLVGSKSPNVSKNPQGFLAKFIREKWTPPNNYKSKAERDELAAKSERARREQALNNQKEAARVKRERSEFKQKEQRVQRIQQSIPETQLIELEEEALKSADDFTVKYIRDDRRKGSLSMIRIEFWHEHIIPKHFANQ